MKAYRIKISTWTSSFRYPNIISGYQPTLRVPPISTILGMLNACAGKYLHFHNFDLGYYFTFSTVSTDLETIYQFAVNGNNVPSNQVKSNVIRREFLYDCKLFLYLTDENIVNYLRNPHYSLLLGRSNDLASIDSIEEVELEEIQNAFKIKGQIVPLLGNYLPGTIQALSKYFTDEIPRRNIGTEPYSIIEYDSPDYPTNLTAFRDVIEDSEVDIFFHHLNLT